MMHFPSPKRVAAGILGLGLTLTLAAQAPAQPANEPAGTATRTEPGTVLRTDDHRDYGWLGLLGLLGLAGLLRLRRNDRRTDDVIRRTT